MSYGNRGPRPLFHGRGGPRFRPYGAVPPYWMGQARGGFGPRFGGPRYGYPDTYHEDYGPEPPFGEPGPGPYGDGVPPVGGAPPGSEALNDVKDWLARAPPGLVRHMYHHCKFLLEKMGVPLEDPQVPPGPSFQRGNFFIFTCFCYFNFYVATCDLIFEYEIDIKCMYYVLFTSIIYEKPKTAHKHFSH